MFKNRFLIFLNTLTKTVSCLEPNCKMDEHFEIQITVKVTYQSEK